jgi:acetylornithine deacetylase/succinyl-diaminopimelate desuccinylase-like protein
VLQRQAREQLDVVASKAKHLMNFFLAPRCHGNNVNSDKSLTNFRFLSTERILNFVEKMKEEDPLIDINVQMPIVFEPGFIDPDSQFAEIVQESVKTVFNQKREFATFIPTTDAHWFQGKGIETILIGSIRPENKVHAEDEFVYIEDLINLTKIYALTALNYLK